MNIGFDAKRAFHNQTGLGHYSRTLIRSLAQYHPEHNYFLFNPKPSSLFSLNGPNLKEVRPQGLLNNLFRSAWRSSWVTRDLQKLHIDLYHGLSHEIPFGIEKTKIKSVVTIHDLIHERFPEQYNPIDVNIYTRKYKNACSHANKVIAISNQTKLDLIEFYKLPGEKIEVCYQSCNPAFAVPVPEAEKQRVLHQYNLPSEFLLSVGSIIERKNLLNVCKAIFLLREELDIPLVVIGNGTKYKQQVVDYVKQNGLEKRVIFLSDSTAAKTSRSFQSASDFPAIYQSATAMIYPSFFEGFGIPVLEALWSKLPVITSQVSSLPEAGGEAAWYVNPNSAEEIAEGIRRIYQDHALAENMKTKGFEHAQNFTQQKCADEVMNVYKNI